MDRFLSGIFAFAAAALVFVALPAQAANLYNDLAAVLKPPANAPYGLSGTAFFVSADGDLLTVAHAVRSCPRIDIISDAMPIATASLIVADPKTDLALLHVNGGRRAPGVLTLAADMARDGQKLSVLGYPIGSAVGRAEASRLSVMNGSIAKPIDTRYVLILNGLTAQGDSGAPLIDGDGRVAGLLRGGYEPSGQMTVADNGPPPVSLGPSRGLVMAFLHEAGLDGRLPGPAPAVTGDPVEASRAAVVRVVCWRASPP